MEIEPFRVAVPEEAIVDLQARLATTRWAPEPGNEDWSFGVNGTYLRELADYWQGRFDWRAQEARINAFPQFRMMVDGASVHFIQLKGKGPRPQPIILNHGWPWTFWDFRELASRLADPGAYGGDPADAFDVVVPSLPGFIFSGMPDEPPGYAQIARRWVRLMKALGYERFFAHGGDAGAYVAAQLGHAHSHAVLGVHMNLPVVPGVGHDQIDPDEFSPAERAMYEAQDFAGRHLTHLMVHIHEPQTLAWAMHDSPIGQAAWMLHRRRAWSDCGGEVERRFSKDELLTHFSLYWYSNSFGTALRTYSASVFHLGIPRLNESGLAIPVPTAVAVLPREIIHLPRPLVERNTDLRQWSVFDRGGHFAGAEEPDLIAADIRSFVRPLRAAE